MKTTKKLVALVLAFVLLSAGALIVQAENTPIFSKTYTGQSYVAISGNAGVENAGKAVSVMLVEKNSASNLTEENIGYIGQTAIDSAGNYALEFYFDGFTYNQSGEVDNYEVILTVVNEKMNQTVTKAEVIADIVQFSDFDFSNFGKIVAEVTNDYNLKKLKYVFAIGFYSESDELLKTLIVNKNLTDESGSAYTYDDIPEGTAYAKGFLWDSADHSIPLANPEQFDIKGYTEGRKATAIHFALGVDETERNFCWYDIAGVEDTKLQYAEKTSDSDTTIFPEGNAKTVMAEYQTVDMRHINGIETSDEGDVWNHNTPYTSSKATITGIEPGKTYVYRFGDKFGWLDGIYEFTAPVNPDKSFTFVMYSDEHSSNYNDNHTKALNRMRDVAFAKAEELGLKVDFIYSTGDVVYCADEEDGYRRYFSHEKMTAIPTVGVSGNHDIIRSIRDDASLYNFHFNNPNQTTDYKRYGGSKEYGSNYWFEYGGVQFIGLSDLAHTDKNKLYIKQAVEEYPDAKLRILASHYSLCDRVPEAMDTANASRHKASDIYKYSHNGTEVDDVMANNGIVLTLSGHVHTYVRSYLIKNAQVVDREKYFGDNVTKNGYFENENCKQRQDEITMELGDGTVYTRVSAASYQHSAYSPNVPPTHWMFAGWEPHGKKDLDGKDVPNAETVNYAAVDEYGEFYDTYGNVFALVTVETPEEGDYYKLTFRAFLNEFYRDTEDGHNAFDLKDTYRVDELVMNIKKQ